MDAPTATSARRLTLASLPLEISALAAAAVVLTYWTFARTPIPHTSPRVHAIITATSWLLLVAAALLAVLAAIHWYVTVGSPGARLSTLARWARALPPWVAVVPVAVSASWVAGRLALSQDPHAAYWPAFWLWVAAMALLAASFLRPDSLSGVAAALARADWRALAPELLAVGGLTAAALVIRTVDLNGLPPLVHVDEEAIGYDAMLTANGTLRNVFGIGWAANPSMGFFIYGAFIKLFGASIHSVRIGSAVWGAASLPLVYLLLRDMFGRGTAFTGAVFLVGYHQHLVFSRVGINVIWDAAAMSTALWFAYRASRDGRPFDFAATGLVSGAALYLYHGTRAVPIVVVAYLAAVALFRWRFARANAANFSLLIAAFVVAAMPILLLYATNQRFFWHRIDEASIFQSGWFDQQRELGRSPISVLWAQTRHAFGGWFVNPDQSPFIFYSPSKPLVQGLATAPLLAGIIYALLHIDDRRYALLLIAFALPTFIGGALTIGPPNAQRLVSAMPAVIGLIAVGLWEVGAAMFPWRRALGAVAAVAAAAALATADARTYFDAARDNVRWGQLQATAAADYLRTLPRGTRIYWYGAPEIRASFSPLTLHDLRPEEVFDSAPAVHAPSSPAPAAFVFLAGYDARLATVRAACPGGATRDVAFRGHAVLVSYELLSPNRCVPAPGPPDAFARALVLADPPVRDYSAPYGASIEPGEPAPCGLGGNTVWYAFTPPTTARVISDTHGSTFDTVIAVYTGASLDALTPVTCNDDGTADTSASVSFDGQAGVTYYIQVGHAAKAPAVTERDVVRISLTTTPLPR